jgi:hypothetical protein
MTRSEKYRGWLQSENRIEEDKFKEKCYDSETSLTVPCHITYPLNSALRQIIVQVMQQISKGALWHHIASVGVNVLAE